MKATERRNAIWKTLCARREESVAHLAAEFNVSQRTIYYDLEQLSLIYPITSVRGRYYGKIKVCDGYIPNPNVFTPKQTELLMRLWKTLHGNDEIIMASIINQFAAGC